MFRINYEKGIEYAIKVANLNMKYGEKFVELVYIASPKKVVMKWFKN